MKKKELPLQKNVIKYHNDLNKIQLPKFTELEQNLLFGILTGIGSNNKVVFTSSDLRAVIRNKRPTNEEIYQFTLSLKQKFFSANFNILKREGKIVEDITVNLFTKMTIRAIDENVEENKKEFLDLTLEVNQEFAYIIKAITKNFTQFELEEFISISGRYAKTLYRLLKQYRQTGFLKMEWDEFVRVMDIEYSTQSDIDNRILKPSVKELSEPINLFNQDRICFKELAYEKIKGKGRGRGGKVIGIQFSFTPQKNEFDYIPTKDQEIKMLRAENEEYVKNYMIDSMAREENEQLKKEVADLQKQRDGVGLSAYKGLKYYSPQKQEIVMIKEIRKIVNSADSTQYAVTILNEDTNKEFPLFCDSIKHILNIIKKYEFDFAPYNDKILNR